MTLRGEVGLIFAQLGFTQGILAAVSSGLSNDALRQ